MKPLSRDTRLAIALFAVLLVVTAAAVWQTQEEVAPPLASFSSEPDGARALRLWLDELGYAVDDTPLADFRLSPDIDLVLMLEPSAGITEGEWQVVDEWVTAGGMLVLAGDGVSTFFAARHYEFELAYLDAVTDALSVQVPLFNSPPLTTAAAVRAQAYWQTERKDFVTYLAAEARPVIVSFEQGDGRVILSAAPYPFSNAGLKEEGNAELVLSMVSAAASLHQVWFDEWHHGVRGGRAEVVGPANWLRRTPSGHALLYVAAVLFLAVVLRGRHFGRPIPLAEDARRRTPVEYITAIANLNRRAGHRTAVLAQYRHWLKRGLGQRYRLDPTLPDADFVDQLAVYRPDLDKGALRKLLVRLRKSKVSESEMVALADEVSTWLKES